MNKRLLVLMLSVFLGSIVASALGYGDWVLLISVVGFTLSVDALLLLTISVIILAIYYIILYSKPAKDDKHFKWKFIAVIIVVVLAMQYWHLWPGMIIAKYLLPQIV